LKLWVEEAQKKELQPILERLIQNSKDIENQTHGLNSLRDIVKIEVRKFSFFSFSFKSLISLKNKLDRITQDQKMIIENFEAKESVEVQIVKKNTQNQFAVSS
jgi:GTP-binding protein EngB required for normal cell division